MKKLILLLVFIALPAVAQDGGLDPLDIRLDMRVDGQISKDYRTFRGHTFKLWLVGDITPNIHYRVRHRLNKPTDPLREGFSGATDQAWISFDFGAHKQWTVMAGKQSVQFGTFEYDYNPADIYMPTMCFDDLDAYKTGVNVAYRFAGQVLNLQVINSDTPQFAAPGWEDKALAFNLLWEGSLWNDVVRTRWAYGAFQHTDSKFFNWLTLGVQFNVGDFTSELDYYTGDRVMNDLRVHDQSAALNLKYNFGKWRPQIKGTWNDRRDVMRSWGAQAAAEYYPFSGERLRDLRFHAAYMYGGLRHGNDSHTFLVGLRWLFGVI